MRKLIGWMCVMCACGASDDPGGPLPGPADVNLTAELVASGFSRPVHLTAPSGDDRLFVVEAAGRIAVFRPDDPERKTFLDLRDRVLAGGERGLLSLAFHPNYQANGVFVVYYTDLDGNTQVVRFTVSSDPDLADAQSATPILSLDQPFPNHNGGLVQFGPDRKLFIGLGDGGSGGDPLGHGQNVATLLGSLLRIDIDGGAPYAIPAGNPFAGQPGAREEIWAYGLRNPWRWWFDQTAGLLYIADVGQRRWEEINVVPAAAGGLNYGWNVAEGDHCFGATVCDLSGFVTPTVEYGHDEGCAVTGGAVYRGTALPELHGHYFYGDFCAGWIRSFRYTSGAAEDRREWDIPPLGAITSFGVDGFGEIYVLVDSGNVYRLQRAPALP